MKKVLFALSLLTAGAAVLPAAGVVNGGFTSCTAGQGTTVPGWTLSPATVDTQLCQSGATGNTLPGGTSAVGPTAGTPWVELNSSPGTPVSLSQTITNLIVGNSYTLTWEERSGYGCCGTAGTATETGISINGATDLITLASGGNSTAWNTYNYTFTAGGTSTVLSLLSQQGGSDTDAGFTAVALNGAFSTAPEPSTLLLLGAGAGVIALRRFRLS